MPRFLQRCCLLFATAFGSGASASDLAFGPGEANFYVHVNLLEMRHTPAGTHLYQWLDREVFGEIEGELGVPIDENFDAVTVFGVAEQEQFAVLLHGFVPQDVRDALVSHADGEVMITEKSAMGLTYWRVEDRHDAKREDGSDGAFVVFGESGQNLITPNEEVMEQFLVSGGHFDAPAPAGLIVLRADHSLVQAGIDDALTDNQHFDSHLFRNVRRAGLVVADVNGAFEVRAEIEAATPEMALALQNIVQGAISLRMLADEQPEAARFLNALEAETVDQVLRLRLTVSPSDLMHLLD